MMEINFTLVVQAFNFFIGYMILRYFLFKPVVPVIEEERAYEKGLHLKVAVGQDALKNREHEKQEQWLGYQQHFVQQVPEISQPLGFIFRGISPIIEVQAVNSQDVARLKREVTHELVQKVEHVH